MIKSEELTHIKKKCQSGFDNDEIDSRQQEFKIYKIPKVTRLSVLVKRSVVTL